MGVLSSIENLSFFVWVRESTSVWGYPTILFMHTIGMALVAGISGAIDLRLLGFAPKAPIKPMQRIFPLMWVGFGINALTGSILLMADASTKLINPDFYVKMVFVFGGIAILYTMQRRIFEDPQVDQTPLPRLAKTLAMLSLICWVGAITAGRLLAYVGPVSGPPGLRGK